ncbi:MAG: right-handed parallel beta-helix repeat-containing protein, partial [Cyclobacteriaceae bacterium]|nr:right-handed parallel beta-helix repeat-containing protein [Cyclobacteriaceae bacterium]
MRTSQIIINCASVSLGLITFLLTPFFLNAQGLSLYISLEGNDKWQGTETKPLKSLEGARNKIRLLRENTTFSDTIKVIVKGGNYQLKSTFVLTPEDGGSVSAPVLYEGPHGEKAIFSGGIQLEGFKEMDNGLWVAHVPEVSYWNWTFDQLYVNGKRAIRAKSPNTGYYKIKEITEEVWIQGKGRNPEKALQIVLTEKDAAKELRSLSKDELDEVVMTVFHHWDITKRHIDRFDPNDNSIYTSGQGMKPWNPWKAGKRFILENYYGALDIPGEWFLRDNGMLYYMPFPNEKIESSTVVAPVLEQLIRIDGDPENDVYVENVTFKNLHFQHSAYYLPEGGFEPNQAALSIDAAIELNGALHIKFLNCQLDHTGGYGIWMNQGVRECEVHHTFLHDLGAGGIRIGETVIR